MKKWNIEKQVKNDLNVFTCIVKLVDEIMIRIKTFK